MCREGEKKGGRSHVKMIFFVGRKPQRREAASTSPLILFSSQYELWWTRGASNGRIKNVLKKHRSSSHVWHVQTCTGPIMYDAETRGSAGVKKKEGERVEDGWGEVIQFCILVREKKIVEINVRKI